MSVPLTELYSLIYLLKKKSEILQDADWANAPSLRQLTLVSVREDLERIRKQGYAVSCGEATEGTTGIAAPIFYFEGQVVGSLNVSGPSFRFTPDIIERNSQLLRKFADKISNEIGFIGLDRK
jgi:IclR family KDG regulon transcriptional repressor